jgi:hypothetical protein
MKLSCLPVSFFTDIIGGSMTIAEWARMGRDLGLDAINISILFVPDRSRSAVLALRKQVEAAGMRVAIRRMPRPSAGIRSISWKSASTVWSASMRRIRVSTAH